jgi:transposase
MRFSEAYGDWQAGRLRQEEAARLLGVSDRTFRRYVDRYHEGGLEGLIDKRLAQISSRRAPVDEVMGLVDLYRDRYSGWNVQHFHTWYRREHGGRRSYTWIKNTLQTAGAVAKAKGKGKHRRRRERSPLPGMMLHQDGSSHEWVPGEKWDLIVTMDDATNEHTSMFFCEEEGTASSLHGIGQTIAAKGLFAMFYTDRGSHYFFTPEAGGKVSKNDLTQVGRALAHLGILHQAAYSPEARGRSERTFGTHQERLPRELALMGITDMEAANRYLTEVYMPNHNREFMVPAQEDGVAYVPYIGPPLADILCEQFERTVGKDNCVSFDNLKLQIPADRYRHHYVKAKVRVHRYVDGTLAVFHGPRRLADYTATGEPITEILRQAA